MRLFLAVTLPDALQEELVCATAPARAAAPAVRWVRAGRLHLTMKFIGERPDADAWRLAGAARDAVADVPSLQASLCGAGAFPNFRRPRVVWIGMHPTEPLAAIARRLDGALLPLGVDAEARPFRAHVTLGRVAGALPPAASQALQEALQQVTASWPLAVREVALVRSALGPGGLSYHVLETLSLGVD